MKQLITDYSFDPDNGIVTLSRFKSIDVGRLLLIANATRGTIIYNFADSTVGSATVVADNAVALSYDTSLMSASDKLTIFYEFGITDPVGEEPPQRVIVEHDVQPVEVDMQIDGVDLRADSPGVQVVSLADPNGDALGSVNGGLLVTDTKGGDPVIGGSDVEIVTGQRVVGSFKEVRFTNPTAATRFTPWIDAAAYRSVSVHLSVGAVTATFQGSNDGVNAVNVSLVNAAAIGATIPAVTGVGPGVFSGTLRTRYFRLSLSAVACQGVITFFTGPQDFNGVPTLPIQTTPAIAGVANAAGALVGSQNEVNSPTIAGAIGSWYPQSDAADGRFNPAVTVANNNITSHTGVGVAAAQLVGQYDDVAPPNLNENTFGRIRVSKNRTLLTGLKDASPLALERGVGVSSRSALQVEDVRSGQFADDPIFQVQPGVQGVALVGETGDPLSTTGSALNTIDVTLRPRFAFSNYGTLTLDKLPTRKILSVIATNANASIRYLQVYDIEQSPISGGIPVFSFPIPSGSINSPGSASIGTEFFGDGFTGNKGLFWAISTDIGSYVAATASEHTLNGMSG